MLDDLLDDPDVLSWDTKANAARCGEIVGEIRSLGLALTDWHYELPGWSRT